MMPPAPDRCPRDRLQSPLFLDEPFNPSVGVVARVQPYLPPRLDQPANDRAVAPPAHLICDIVGRPVPVEFRGDREIG